MHYFRKMILWLLSAVAFSVVAYATDYVFSLLHQPTEKYYTPSDKGILQTGSQQQTVIQQTVIVVNDNVNQTTSTTDSTALKDTGERISFFLFDDLKQDVDKMAENNSKFLKWYAEDNRHFEKKIANHKQRFKSISQ